MNFYDYQRPVGKITDISELRDEFITIFDEKSKADAVRFGLLYGKHILDITGIAPVEEITNAFSAMERWLNGEANYHEARNIAFGDLHKKAREEGDLVRERFYRTMAQIACIPHVKFHALWATDFALTLINRMHPGDIDEVRKERQAQIAIFKSV